MATNDMIPGENARAVAAMVREEDLQELEALHSELVKRVDQARSDGRVYLMSQYVRLVALLLQQQDTLHLTVKAEYGGRLVGVIFAGQTEERLAWLCERSSEYHQHRVRALDVHRVVSLVICRKHDSVLPVPVIDLAGRMRCEAFQPPHWYQPDMRATKRGSSVFLGQLICGITSAYDQLESLPPSTQRRYRRKVKVQARGRRGRPIKLPREESPVVL